VKYAAKFIKDRLAELGIPRRAIVAATGADGVGVGHSFEPEHKNTIVENADRLAATGDLGVIITRYPCGCVFKAIVTTDPRHHGKVTQREISNYIGHECGEDAA
jgi:hypothetical protein